MILRSRARRERPRYANREASRAHTKRCSHATKPALATNICPKSMATSTGSTFKLPSTVQVAQVCIFARMCRIQYFIGGGRAEIFGMISYTTKTVSNYGANPYFCMVSKASYSTGISVGCCASKSSSPFRPILYKQIPHSEVL